MLSFMHRDIPEHQNMANQSTTYRREKSYPKTTDMNTGQLFEKYTINEIRKIEQETRADIEKKKEDLRQMVGERYRDLIDAADTISDMKTCTEKIVTAVQGMQEYCTKLQKTHMVKGVLASPRVNNQDRSSQNEFYAVASQTKLLMDMPEKIWSAVESSQHLKATELYLLACHIVSSLQLDGNTQQSAQLLAWFPVLSRQWAAISHFKGGILQSCRKMLKNGSVSDQATAEALCSIMLLEETSPRQVFTEFLLARKAAVQQCFHSSQHGIGVKGQICNVAELISITVKQIYAVFYHRDQSDEDSCNLLLKTLHEVTSGQSESSKKGGILQNEVGSATFTKHLPHSVISFRPSLRTPSTTIAATYLQQSVEQWIETCIQDVHSGVGKLLNHVMSMKALAAIRDAVWNLLAQDDDNTWTSICQSVIDRHLSVWGEFIRPLFLTRMQAIIQDSLDKASTSTQRHTQHALSELQQVSSAERDVAAYVWVEAPSDTPSAMLWKGKVGFSKDMTEPGGLYMKARAFTPRTQGICTSLDIQLKSLLDDVAQYTDAADPQHKVSIEQPAKKSQPFDKFADTVTLHSFLQISCTTCLHRLLGFFSKQLEETKSQLEAAVHLGQMEQSSRVVDWALLLGRLCSAIIELCPNLQRATNIAEPETKPTSKPEPQSWFRSKLMGKRGSKPTQSEEVTEWDKLKELLVQHSQDAYRIWSEFAASITVANFDKYLNDASCEALLKAATHWDLIEIQEESEDGKKVTSKVRLPVQASWYIQTVLHSLCEEINRVGGHALSRTILAGLIEDTSSRVLALYTKHLNGRCAKGSHHSPTQSQALQLLFDIRFLATIMSGRGEDTKKNSTHKDTVQRLVDRLENLIDPFDLDVFLPHLQTNLNRHTHRCTMLLGALASPEKHLYSTHRAMPSGYQEQHNVLPLANSQGRFTLLPLSTTSSQSLPRSLPRPLPQHTSPVEVTPDLPSPPPILHKSRTAPSSLYSKFGSLKTGWLANIGGAQ